MHNRPSGERGRKHGALHWLVQLPGAILGLGTGTLQLDAGAVWCDRGDDTVFREGNSSKNRWLAAVDKVKRGARG